VTIEPLGTFAGGSPAVRFGYYDAGTPTARTELFTVGSADAQTVNPALVGVTSFDPGAKGFGIYATFPIFGNTAYSEDALNTKENTVADRRKVRFYALKNADGSVVPNAYIFTSEDYVNDLRSGFHGRWVDVHETKGKRSGAYSWGAYAAPPVILMNWNGTMNDVFTLAHEAGHAMHSFYSDANLPFHLAGYPIFLAEIASTVNEVLLTWSLLAQTPEDDAVTRFAILDRFAETYYGTVVRQTMFAEFEKITHAMEEAGEPLTLDTFRQAYRGLLDAYFGPDFTIDSELELECLRIPHFYSAFYVYKYATGLSAAVALASQVLETGDATRYLGFLRSGGSEFPIPTLQRAGVDMSNPAPVEATLQLFARRVEELESLLGG
jgi:oligoendopeptidase F